MLTEAKLLFDELRELTKGWTRHDRVLPGEAQAKEIGRQLNEIGGEQMMQDAYYFVTSVNPAASVLSMYWDGIGEWRW